MAQLVVRQLDDDVKAKLQRRARRHGRSTEEEVREILRNAVKNEGGARSGLGTRLAARFSRVGLRGQIPELRGHSVQPVDFEE
ncbi:MAG TPA: ribbon-helix-helix protein, CopG family [Thermoanaerobaculia bacterium]|nr:ribbon-helix-helix protein, CopG family [Thermoanaerobaculia bacterium]